jgi:hypothetical protein
MGPGARDRDALSPTAYPNPLLAKVAQGVLDVAGAGSEPGLDAVLRALGEDERAAQAAMALAAHVDRIHRPVGRPGADEGSGGRLEAAWAEGVRRVRRDAGLPGAGLDLKSSPDASALLAAMRQSVERKKLLGVEPGALPRPYQG